MSRPNTASANFEDSEQTPARAEVARLIESHLSYSHAIASEVIRRLPPDLEKKDMEGWAELGLVEAANAFDRTRGVQFKTFSYYRIKGAVYDGLRKTGWYPRGQYQQMRFEMAANEYMKDAAGESAPPSSADAQLRDLKDLTGSVVTCYMLSLDALPQEPVDEGQTSAEETAVRNQEKKHIRFSLAQLPEMNRKILEHCYFEGLTLEEAGRKLGYSKSWMCRLHAKSLEMLRKQLNQIWGSPASPSPATISGILR
ncbi:MAG TPA: sigma-70 family RNA polymerase sigma factor [Terriglobales bacterium]|jgi:RNA polymerase sigma factor for flagellar operon FliA|nr:sigma-70 family RNA polymerase sigma factor [Terriglobales bacterium]